MKHLLSILCLFIFSCDSGGDDAVEVEGCTNINATNFNTNATIDDGSCTVHGCLDSQACNYDSTAVIDNNSCDYTLNNFGCCNDLIKDCADECGGTAEIDICGVCGTETEINNCSIFGHWQYAYSEDYNNSDCSGEPYEVEYSPNYDEYEDIYQQMLMSFNGNFTYISGEQICLAEDNGDINLDECNININQDMYQRPYSIQNLEGDIFTDKVLVLNIQDEDDIYDLHIPFTISNSDVNRTLICYLDDEDLQACSKTFFEISNIDLNNYNPQIED